MVYAFISKMGTYKLKKEKTSLLILSLFQAIPFTFLITPLQLLLLAKNADHHTLAWSAIAVAPYSLKFIWSPLIDHLSSQGIDYRRMMMVTSSLIASLFILIACMINDIKFILLFSFLLGFASATFDEIMDGYSSSTFPKLQQTKILSVRMIGYRLGMLSTVLISWLAYHNNWQSILLSLSLLLLIVKLPLIGFLPFCSTQKVGKKIDWLSPIKFAQKVAPKGLATIVTFRLGELWLHSALAIFLIKHLHWHETEVIWSLQFFGVLASIGGTILASQYLSIESLHKHMRHLALMFLLCIVLFASTLSIKSTIWIYTLILFYEVLHGMKSLACQLLFYKCMDPEYPSYSYSLFNSLSTLSRVLFPPLIHIVLTTNNWLLFFEVGIILTLISCYLARHSEHKHVVAHK